MKTVLVVEDEMKIARVVRDYLTDAGYEVIVASSGEAALASARGSKPDLVVLDLGLPGVDGLDVARELRGSSRVPIVMLTARGEETDRIVGLELGADDYVVKPFSPKELVARVRALFRRSSTAEMLREQPIRVLTKGVQVVHGQDVRDVSEPFLVIQAVPHDEQVRAVESAVAQF